MTNLDSILKSRDITLPAKVHLFNAMVFHLAMYGCESWTTKKAEQRRIDAIFFILSFIYLFTLQYCIGFVIHLPESAMGIHVFHILNPLGPPSPSHPTGSSQCPSLERHVSCIKPGLAIRFTCDNLHV